MTLLQRASLSYLLRHPWQLGLAILGIAVGVAVIVAVDLSNASSRKAFLLSMDTINGRATHQIVGGPQGLDENLYATLRTDRAVSHAAPVVDGVVIVNDIALNVLGVDVFAEGDFRAYSSLPATSDGVFSTLVRLLNDPGSVLLSAPSASRLGVSLDNEFAVVAGGKTFEATVIGYLNAEASDQSLGDLLVVDIATAQEWFNQAGRLSRIDLRLRSPQASQALAARLPEGVRLLSAESRTESRSSMTNAFMTNLTAMSLLALLVGVFLIYNSVAFAVVQRRPLIGTLRALGVTRGDALSLMLSEALVLGLVGAGLGAAAGVLLGQELLALVSRSINDLYFRVSVTDVSIELGSLAKGIGAGVAATLVAAAVPAKEAIDVPPTLSMSRSTLERRAGVWVLILVAGGACLLLLAWLLLVSFEQSLLAGLTALFLLILGAAFCIPFAVQKLARLLAPLAARLGGQSARLAVEGIGASLSRTGVAVVALAVAVSATIGVSVMVDSFRGAVIEWLDESLESDLYVAVASGSLDPTLVADIAALPEVTQTSDRRFVRIDAEEGEIRIMAIRPRPGGGPGVELRDVAGEATLDRVWSAFAAGGQVLVSDAFAYRRGVSAGDVIEIPTDRGSTGFTIAGIYRSYDANQGAILMHRTTYDRNWNDERIDSMGLYLAPDTAVAGVVRRIRDMSRGRQALLLSSNAELRSLSLEIFDRTFIITDVLYWLAIGVAIVGILGAMLALQLERTRELGLMRAIGFTPGQLGAVVLTQTGVIGLLSGLAALPLGVAMASFLIDVINRRSYGWQMDLSVDPTILLAAMGLAVGAAFAAGLYPAWRAATTSPAFAMREE